MVGALDAALLPLQHDFAVGCEEGETYRAVAGQREIHRGVVAGGIGAEDDFSASFAGGNCGASFC